MVQYDPSIIQKAAENLYLQARRVLVIGALFGFIVGALVPIVVSIGVSGGRGLRTPETLIAGTVGLLIGFVLAQGRAFSLKLQAQVALCQAEIEKNTRPARPAASPPPLSAGASVG